MSTLLFMLVFQALLWPIFCLLYGFSPLKGAITAWTGFLLGDIGFVSLGVLLSAIAIHIRSREVILPLLLCPLCLPVLIGGVHSTTVALAGGGFSEIGGWFGRLIAFDVIFLSLGSILFPFVVEE